jgi:hypothetical protein
VSIYATGEGIEVELRSAGVDQQLKVGWWIWRESKVDWIEDDEVEGER